MKKLLSLFLAAVMLISCVSITSFTSFANVIEEAPVITLDTTVQASINDASQNEKYAEFYIKFIPEETDVYEFVCSNLPSTGIVMGYVVDDEEAPVGEGGVMYGSFIDITYKNPVCAANLTAGNTYYFYLTSIGVNKKIFVDVSVKRGHTHNITKQTLAAYATSDTKWDEPYDGGVYDVCMPCGYEKELSKIYYPKTVSISKSAYAYTGKAIKPAVTVKDRKGNVIPASNYKVKYKANKNVGTATITVEFKGDKYYGELVKSFKIIPKATSISSLKAASKAFTVKWKKQATQTTGYQIQYTTDKKMKKSLKTVTVSKNSTTSKKISGLKSKKTYYVRVRTYKTVSGKKYYSDWSKIKTVKTK